MRFVFLGCFLGCFVLLAACAPASQPLEDGATPPHLSADLPVEGVASWYGPGFIGRLTANGELYTAQEMTAAHRVLPFGTLVRVTHLQSGRSIVVRINDRGPFLKGRVIDLSQAAAERLGMIHSGIARVRLDYASSLDTSSRLLAAASQDLKSLGIANTPALNPYLALTLME